jgi:hypothetical protein
MNQLNGGHKEFARVVADNYSQMEEQLAEAGTKNHQLSVENGVLLAEVNMLREQLEASQRDARRLQAVASTFGGQARALQAVFTSITELAVKHGIEAAEAPQAHQEPAQEPPVPVARETGPAARAPADALHVDWSVIQKEAADGT